VIKQGVQYLHTIQWGMHTPCHYKCRKCLKTYLFFVFISFITVYSFSSFIHHGIHCSAVLYTGPLQITLTWNKRCICTWQWCEIVMWENEWMTGCIVAVSRCWCMTLRRWKPRSWIRWKWKRCHSSSLLPKLKRSMLVTSQANHNTFLSFCMLLAL